MKLHVPAQMLRALDAGKAVRLLAAATLAGFATLASAQYPNKPITLVVPYQAGGAADGIARAAAEAASKEIGQAIVVDNKAGAEGQIGSQDVKNAPPDGYKILLAGAGSLVQVPALRKVPPYDAVKDFTPIAGTAEFSFFLYVHPSFPAKNLKEFVEYVKANPGKVNYATGNNQGLLSMEYMKQTLGLDMVKVSYKGEGAAMTDLLTNRVQAMFATSLGYPHVKDGKLRVLATTLTKRSRLMPDVPTMTEGGQQAIPFGGGWVAIVGPAGLPKDITDKLSKAFLAANLKPEVEAKRDAVALAPMQMNAEQLGKHIANDVVLYRNAVRDYKLQQE